MLFRTFQQIPGVGPFREKELWSQGIKTWDDFPAAGTGAPALSRKADELAREVLGKSREALERRDLRALAQLIPSREHWRMYPDFAQDALFFDIETDGKQDNAPTVVSLFDSEGLHVFIKGRNMDALPEAMAAKRLWVSFNGTCFDAPVLRDYFGESRFPVPEAHVDLRFVTKRLRMSGGLKEIEDNLGVGRPPHLKGVNGWDAVLLWRAYLARGDVEALRFLVEYNLYDAFQLRTLMDVAYNRGADELNQDVPRLPVFDRGEVLYDVSKIILELGPTERDMQTLARVRSQDRDLRDG
ncbi:ribonuclease H-like domain-containing protein [Hyalangium rubrum]|uniref:Ribonuclease H-like domain-containing protein n=1 Tax=Hyalangium rubrum TaxID=3103134 RepID=A0ABU5HGD4_9BACT|nr:ribonuclease H-like domain-containing protein [Hyalangium sp. s54d21]MDY7231145.1 ribonuclease H-like domain-containing protein [Hyalangium sp. s54d21]